MKQNQNVNGYQTGEGWATEKIDGTCCLIKDGRIYRRYDYKKGRTLPQGAIPCQEEPDPITGHFPHWLLCTENDPNAKYYLEAFERQRNDNLEEGTYELIGKHINGNPYNLDTDILEKEKKDRIEQVGLMTDLEIEYFNEEFVKYEGDLQRKSNVKSLVLKVLSNNISNTDMQISIDGVIILNKDDTKVPEELNELDNTKKYNIKFNYGKYGNIESINIEEAKEKLKVIRK